MLPEFFFHHIGIATDSIIKTSKYYYEAGYEVGEIIYDPIQHVKVCFINRANTPRIELVEPIDEESPVKNIISKNGVGPYHFCYELDDINEGINNLKLKQFIPLSKPVPAVAFNNRIICFLYNRNIGLVELLQK